jgi:DNA helicase TIP49 (TBP-interacting protein)
MQHFQVAILAVDTGEIWYKVCKDSQQRHKQGKAEIVPCELCMIKVEYMIDIESFLLFSIKALK